MIADLELALRRKESREIDWIVVGVHRPFYCSDSNEFYRPGHTPFLLLIFISPHSLSHLNHSLDVPLLCHCVGSHMLTVLEPILLQYRVDFTIAGIKISFSPQYSSQMSS